jgi:hypothetical protein
VGWLVLVDWRRPWVRKAEQWNRSSSSSDSSCANTDLDAAKRKEADEFAGGSGFLEVLHGRAVVGCCCCGCLIVGR